MSTYVFTYGANHLDKHGDSLGRCYTPVEAEFPIDARSVMLTARGNRWSMVYDSKEEAGVERFNLVERSLKSVSL